MSYVTSNRKSSGGVPLVPLHKRQLKSWKDSAEPRHQLWLEACGFEARPGQCLALPGKEGHVESWLFGMQENGWLYQLAAIFNSLPKGEYVLGGDWDFEAVCQASLGWGLAAYRFERYKSGNGTRRELELAPEIAARVQPLLAAQYLVRDLVNTPTEHMGPEQLADAVAFEADQFGAQYRVTTGDELLSQNFPAIHAVGRASCSKPRLVEMSWGDASAPLLVLVGKGVCFDTGGLDLKNTSGMALMKKDMGGAAHALALARLVMQHALPVRLLLLIPAVENSVSGNAYRPGDVVVSRNGLSVEIGNTDAEGRVVLADALAYACERDPELIIDFATLTGAARVALGTDLPPLFSNQPGISQAIQQAGDEWEDPLWTMPLYQPYLEQIRSPIADLNNSSKSAYGGCITAALFLQQFITPDTPWVHIDTFAWNQSSRPGRPEGGEALGLRAVFRYLQQRYA